MAKSVIDTVCDTITGALGMKKKRTRRRKPRKRSYRRKKSRSYYR